RFDQMLIRGETRPTPFSYLMFTVMTGLLRIYPVMAAFPETLVWEKSFSQRETTCLLGRLTNYRDADLPVLSPVM
ncbi:hypothetical protein Q4R48_08395, partial [Morganella morganii]